MMRLCYQEHMQTRAQWHAYRWVSLCADLALAGLMLLALAF